MTTEYSEFENETEGTETENGPKALREALAKQKAQNEAIAKELADLKAEKRTRDLADTLKDKGLSPKVAKFIPADVELDDWLKENGELFGVTAADGEPVTQAQEVEQATVAPHPLESQFAGLTNAQEGATAPSGTVDLAKAQEALATGGLEQFEAYLRSQPKR